MFALTTFSYHVGLEQLKEKLKKLRKIYPGPLIHKILVFGVPAEDALERTNDIIPILSSKISPITNLGTIMCDATTDFLAELAIFMIARQMGSFKSPIVKEFEQPVRPSNRVSISFKPMHSRTGSGGSGLSSPTGSSFSSTRPSTTKTGSISLALNDKIKIKQRGRMLKFLAGMYLIAGRWQDALRDFTEAATLLKSAHDHLWHGSALEGIGICLVLLSFLEAPVAIPAIALSSSITTTYVSDSVSDTLSPTSSHSSYTVSSIPPPMFEFLPELTGNLLVYYAKSQSSSEESVPQIVYCESILRLANLLAITRLAGGWNPASLNALVRGHAVETNITRESPSVSAIASWCNKVYGTDLTNMNMQAQSKILCGIAAIYSNIGLVRKRTFILRELILNLVPKIAKTRASYAASNAVHAQSATVEKHFSSFLNARETNNNIVDMLDSLSNVYGAGDITSVGYGWNALRVSFLKICLSLCESLLDFVGIVHYAGLLLSTSADLLSNDDQLRLAATIMKATESARNLGQGHILATYWDPNILRDIKVIPTNSSILPQFNKKVNISSTGTDVFLHNPYIAKRASLEPATVPEENVIMVQKERTEFTIKLQNPFAFELHIYELSLLTENDFKVRAVTTNIYIPPNSFYDLSLPAIPLDVGKLKILGCRIHVEGCQPQNFELIAKTDFLQESKIKQIGVESGTGKGLEERLEASTKRTLEVDVIEAQPVIVLKSLSLNQNWILLLEGEKQIFTFTVANISNVPVNFVNLKFLDSTTQPLQVALTNKDLPLNEIYEVEYFLFRRKALKWKKADGDEREIIEPHTVKTFEIRVLGKRGMTEGVIEIEYSHQPNLDQLGKSHWSRTLSIPINVTVNSSIELGGCDMIPLQHNQNFTDNIENHELAHYLDQLKENGVLSEYCLLVIDLRNSWTQTIEVTLWSSRNSHGDSIQRDEDNNINDCANPVEEDLTQFSITTLINAGRTARLLVPVKRVKFSSEQLERPIPNLSKRQFIVDSTSSPDQQRLVRENFWYRDALLHMLDGTWKVVNGLSRSGILELRGIRLSQKMINVLRVESVQIKMHAVRDSDNEEANQVPLEDNVNMDKNAETTLFTATTENDYWKLSTVVTNDAAQPLSGVLRIIPTDRYNTNFYMDSSIIESKILVNGTLQKPIIRLLPGESVTIDLGMVFLVTGEYQWTSVFEIIDGTRHIQRDPVYFKAV